MHNSNTAHTNALIKVELVNERDGFVPLTQILQRQIKIARCIR